MAGLAGALGVEGGGGWLGGRLHLVLPQVGCLAGLKACWAICGSGVVGLEAVGCDQGLCGLGLGA